MVGGVGTIGALAAAVVLTAGCGTRVPPGDPTAPSAMAHAGAEAAGSPQATVAPPGGAQTDEIVGTPMPSASPAPSTPNPGATDPTSAPQAPDYGPEHDNGVVTMTLSRSCATRGTLMTADVKAPPNAGIAAVVTFSDNKTHGVIITGESDGRGVFVWRFVVPATAPAGNATALVRSTGPGWEGEGGSAHADFKVVNRQGECG